jgi:hypothetical protein
MTNNDEWNTAGGGSYWNYAEEGKGAVVQGTYINKKEHQGDYDSTVYVIKTDTGVINVNSSTVLNRKFEEVSLGDEVRVEYLGTAESEKRKGAQYHDFDVKYRSAPMKTAGEEEVDLDELMVE